MHKNTIKDVILNGLNSGLGYDLSDFIFYFMNNYNSEFDRDIEKIKNSLMDAQIERTLDQPISRYTKQTCY